MWLVKLRADQNYHAIESVEQKRYFIPGEPVTCVAISPADLLIIHHTTINPPTSPLNWQGARHKS